MPMIAPKVREEPEVARLLAAARAAVADVPYCWVVTAADGGNAHARVVKAFPNETGEDWWTRWFLTRRLARKTTEIRNAGHVTLAFQHDSGKAYVSLAGRAELIDERPAVESRLQQVDDPADALSRATNRRQSRCRPDRSPHSRRHRRAVGSWPHPARAQPGRRLAPGALLRPNRRQVLPRRA